MTLAVQDPQAYVFPSDAAAAAVLRDLGLALTGPWTPKAVLEAAARAGRVIDVVVYVATEELAAVLAGSAPESRVLLRHPGGIDPSLGRRLKALSASGLPWQVRVAADPPDAALHAKVFVIHLEGSRRLCLVGSSNGTHNGLSRNLEVNVAFVADAASPSATPLEILEALWAGAAPGTRPSTTRPSTSRPLRWRSTAFRMKRSPPWHRSRESSMSVSAARVPRFRDSSSPCRPAAARRSSPRGIC